MSNGHLTAIHRTSPSTPVRFLLSAALIVGRVLDYGCGRGFDVGFLAQTFDAHGFDPYHRPAMPDGLFDTITCNFVLNVIPDEAERNAILTAIQSKLAPNGIAYISVRNDARSLKGWTSKGTWQGKVELDFPIQKKTAGFVMYRMVKCKYHSYCCKADDGFWFCPDCGMQQLEL